MRVLDKVMIIDDDPVSGIILEKVNAHLKLAKEIIGMYSAVDGLDYLLGLEERQQVAPDIIFLDIRMPIVNGWQFLEQYKTLQVPGLQNTTVFMLAASSDQSDINRAKKFASVEDYIVKPLTANRLRKIQASLSSISQTSNSLAT